MVGWHYWNDDGNYIFVGNAAVHHHDDNVSQSPLVPRHQLLLVHTGRLPRSDCSIGLVSRFTYRPDQLKRKGLRQTIN